MSRFTTCTLLAAAALVAGFTMNTPASAEERLAPTLRLQPQPEPLHQLPKFGFLSEFHHYEGYYVKGVYHYTAASQMGLERGDHIVGAKVNGHFHSFRHGGWSQVVREAMHGSGWLTFYIKDVRTDYTVTRSTNVHHWGGSAVVRANAYGH